MKVYKAVKLPVYTIPVMAIVALLTPLTTQAQAEKLGIVRYTAPAGMTKTVKENIVAFSELNQTTGTFCIITLYGATPGTGDPQSDFAREWNNLVIKTMKKAEAKPKTDEQKADGWTVVSGGSEVESDVGKAIGFLTVVSGSGRTVSVLAVFNDPEYVKKIDAFVTAIDLDKPSAPANTAAQPAVQNGKLVIPLPNRQLTITDLAGEWGEDAQRISTTYVDRSSGAYRGTDNLSFRSKMSFTARGGYLNDFFAIQNGKKIIDKTTGTFSINGRVLSITQRNTARYVIRGWLELPDMTILVVCGPWYDGNTIPAEIFSNPDQGANLNNTWVRKN
ncbi:MAG TPA: hypothetical protein VNA17_08795 [Pyrinomonadaceae bacterium]|nr:hypothetical protein [Pyrinomonadaceae bacterium]